MLVLTFRGKRFSPLLFGIYGREGMVVSLIGKSKPKAGHGDSESSGGVCVLRFIP